MLRSRTEKVLELYLLQYSVSVVLKRRHHAVFAAEQMYQNDSSLHNLPVPVCPFPQLQKIVYMYNIIQYVCESVKKPINTINSDITTLLLYSSTTLGKIGGVYGLHMYESSTGYRIY